jgi:hypothetical protein
VKRPVSIGKYLDGATCYLPRREAEDRAAAAPCARTWRFRKTLRAAMIGKTLIRPIENFGNSISLEDLGRFLADAGRLGVPDPSNPGDLFHRLFMSPRCCATINNVCRPYFRGGWEATLSDRADAGARLYDMTSAYAWAGCRPLPEPNSAYLTTEWTPDGLYEVEGTLAPGMKYPPGLRGGTCRALLTVNEIDMYRMKDVRMITGLRFRRWVDLAPTIYRIADMCKWHKPTLRAYWGRWASSTGVTCQIERHGNITKEWTLPPMGSNFLWAGIITALVRGRCWAEVMRGGVHHVFVDSLVIDRRLDTGSALGAWREVERYGKPLRFYSPGNWGAENGERVKHSGISDRKMAELTA